MDWRDLKILILDGDPVFSRWAAGVLADGKGAEVRCTDSPVTAFQMLHQFPAHVGLVDLRLPEVGGMDFLRWMRNPEHSPNVDLPLVLTATKADAHSLRSACEIGIDSFMHKPIPEDRFLRRLLVTVTSPNRFVIGKDYFGPDRRKADLPFDGPDRRSAKAAQGQATIATARPEAGRPSRPQAAEPGSAAGPGQKARAWQGDAPEGPRQSAAKGRLSDEDVAAAAKPARSDDAWKEALAEQGASQARRAAAELAIDLAPILAEHLAWLRSGGREGQRAILRKADLHGVDLHAVNLSDADLQEAILSDCDCRDANFQGADMRHADLSSMNGAMSNLGVARLRHANMSRALLNGANLRGTDLAGASLSGAALNEADLTGSNLLSTDLRQTDLSGVRGLTQAQLAKARADSSTRLPTGLRLPRKDT